MTASEPGLTPTKLALRRTVRAQRQARPADQRDHLATLLALVAMESPVIRAAGCVALYVSMPEEPGTAPLRAALRARRTRVLLPVIMDDDALGWAEDEGDEAVRTSARFGVPEPTGRAAGPEELAAADVVLVPATAVDSTGLRLGRGRGYYDRALRCAGEAATVLALLFDEEVLDATTTPVPREPHDKPVDGVLTPTRWLFFR